MMINLGSRSPQELYEYLEETASAGAPPCAHLLEDILTFRSDFDQLMINYNYFGSCLYVLSDISHPLLTKYGFDSTAFMRGARYAYSINKLIWSKQFFDDVKAQKDSSSSELIRTIQATHSERLYGLLTQAVKLQDAHEPSSEELLECFIVGVDVDIVKDEKMSEIYRAYSGATYPIGSVVASVEVLYKSEYWDENIQTVDVDTEEPSKVERSMNKDNYDGGKQSFSKTTEQFSLIFQGVLSGNIELNWIILSKKVLRQQWPGRGFSNAVK